MITSAVGVPLRMRCAMVVTQNGARAGGAQSIAAANSTLTGKMCRASFAKAATSAARERPMPVIHCVKTMVGGVAVAASTEATRMRHSAPRTSRNTLSAICPSATSSSARAAL